MRSNKKLNPETNNLLIFYSISVGFETKKMVNLTLAISRLIKLVSRKLETLLK